jgi:soluble lytic murein transglycosylase
LPSLKHWHRVSTCVPGAPAGIRIYRLWRRRVGLTLFVWLFAAAAVLLGGADARAHAKHEPQPQRNRIAKAEHAKVEHTKPEHAKAEHAKHGSSEATKEKKQKTTKTAKKEKKATATKKTAADEIPLPIERPAAADLPPGLAAVRDALGLIDSNKLADAMGLEKSIADPVGQKLVEWALLRRADAEVAFQRYANFIAANPGWPSLPLFRRRAEAALWSGHPDAATVRRFLAREPESALGRLALARVLASDGDQAQAEREVRAVWRSAPLPDETEAAVLKAFPDAVTRADNVTRMDRRIGAKEFGAATRAAKRLGDDQVAIVKACAAAEAKASNGGKLLDAVPESARDDLGYALCRIHWLLRNDSPGSNIHGRIVTPKDDVARAAKLALAGSPDDLAQQDTDEWWRERRALARKLLDLGDATTAYQVVAKAAPPANPYYRAEAHFMAGWIALRFLDDANAAAAHFVHIGDGETDPRILARAAYWRGRAAEALGQLGEMRAQYEAASHYPTAYYGQLARIRLGLDVMTLPALPPQSASSAGDVVAAAAMLYRIGEHDWALRFISDLAKESSDAGALVAVGKLTAQYHDAPATLIVGKDALARGMPLDQLAFPDFGVPAYSAVGPALDRSIVYSVVRTESAFDQHDKSSANAVGLMQVTPGAGRDTAKRFGVRYDWHRMVTDAVYNTQMGAAELAALLKEYRDCYALSFAAYNAGRGRVQQWLALHGDPRDPNVDAIDWVERIPFAETRNYVQRVLENLQVYRARFDARLATAAPAANGAPDVGRASNVVEAIPH